MPKTELNASVEIYTGIAGTGKTTALLEEYRSELAKSAATLSPGSNLWLTPTHRSRRTIVETLLDANTSSFFAPNVLTFDEFAEKILRAKADTIKPLSPTMKRIVVRHVVDGLHRSQQLQYFAGIAHTSGFLDLVTSFISELKREEIWPEAFVEACEDRGVRDKDRELALIYQEYQQALHRLSLYDSEGRFWSAREALKQGVRGPFQQLSLIVVDGFTDFTHTQYEILTLLAGFAQRLVVSLPFEEPLARHELFAKTAIARQQIGKLGTTKRPVLERRFSRVQSDSRVALKTIAESVFGNPRDLKPQADGEGIEVLAAAGQLSEVESLAKRIKQLLAAGVPPDQIVVAFRSLNDYADLIREVFIAAGIPFYCDADQPLARTSLVKALFSVLQLELEDWPFDRLMSVLRSSYFRPRWPGRDLRSTISAVAAQLRRCKFDSHRQVMLDGLTRRIKPEEVSAEASPEANAATSASSANTATGQIASGQTASGQTAVALGCLQWLSDITERLRRKSDFQTWTDILLSLARDLGIVPRSRIDQLPVDEQRLAQRDQRIWEVLTGILYEAAGASDLVSGVRGDLSLQEFTSIVHDLLENESLASGGNEQGRIRILNAGDVRHLDVPYLFLAGLTETSFPQSRGDDCIYNETERRELGQRGISLRHRTSENQDEMLLFYGVVTRARQNLILSYPAINSSGQPLFASPYLTAVVDLYAPGAVTIEHTGQLDPVPPLDSVLTVADFRIAATAAVRDKQPGLFRALFEREESRETARNILAATDLLTQRFHTREFTRYEGLVRESENLKRLRDRFRPDGEFSTTQLEAYANCPFQFFMSYVLGIAPLGDPEMGTDYLSRGTLVHDVLSTLYRELIEQQGTIAGAKAEDISARFRELVTENLQRSPGESELQRALISVEERLLHDWADAFGGQAVDYQKGFGRQWTKPPEPTKLEVAFGRVPEQEHDVREMDFDCVSFGSGDNTTFIRGRIDRIDVGQIDDKRVFNIIDYKTGKEFQFNQKDVETGQQLQLALYTLAVRRLQMIDAEAEPFQMGYWFIRQKGFTHGLKTKQRKASAFDALESATLAALETTLDEIVPRLAQGIRNGTFPVYSAVDDCTRLCPYKTVCRVNQIRPLERLLDKHIDLIHPDDIPQ